MIRIFAWYINVIKLFLKVGVIVIYSCFVLFDCFIKIIVTLILSIANITKKKRGIKKK